MTDFCRVEFPAVRVQTLTYQINNARVSVWSRRIRASVTQARGDIH